MFGSFLIIASLSIYLAYLIVRGNKSFMAKWRKIKFETIMGLNGFVGGTKDLFHRSKDKVGKKLGKLRKKALSFIFQIVSLRFVPATAQNYRHDRRKPRHRFSSARKTPAM